MGNAKRAVSRACVCLVGCGAGHQTSALSTGHPHAWQRSSLEGGSSIDTGLSFLRAVVSRGAAFGSIIMCRMPDICRLQNANVIESLQLTDLEMGL